jgi:hypothetical protein
MQVRDFVRLPKYTKQFAEYGALSIVCSLLFKTWCFSSSLDLPSSRKTKSCRSRMFPRRASDYLRVPTDEPSYSLPAKEEIHSSRLPSSASETLCLRLVLSAILTASLVATVLLSLCLAILVRQRSDNELQVSQLLSPIPKRQPIPTPFIAFRWKNADRSYSTRYNRHF